MDPKHFTRPQRRRLIRVRLLLSQSKSSLHPPPDLSPHRIPSTLRSLHSVPILLRPSQQVLHALARGSPYQVLEHTRLEHPTPLGREDFAANLVRHTLQLRKGDLRASLGLAFVVINRDTSLALK